MALVKCPDCGSDVSDKATSCPKCGCPRDAMGGAPATALAVRAPESSAPAAVSDSERLSKAALARFPSITDTIPAAQKAMLAPGEQAIHFAYTGMTGGGCASSPVVDKDQWFLVTNERVMYQASIRQGEGGSIFTLPTVKSGTIPLSKISFVASRTFDRSAGGCSTVKAIGLQITSSGGQIEVMIPTLQEGERCRTVLEQLIK